MRTVMSVITGERITGPAIPSCLGIVLQTFGQAFAQKTVYLGMGQTQADTEGPIAGARD